jgi:hypothetical protein
MREVGRPLDSFDIRHAQLTEHFFCGQIIHEKRVISLNKDFAKRCGENHFNLVESLFNNRPLLRILSVERANKDFSI